MQGRGYDKMKKIKCIFGVVVVALSFMFLSCDFGNKNQTPAGGEEQKEQGTEQKQEEVAPIPDIETGEYMVSGSNQNIVIKINKDDGNITMMEFSDFDGYLRFGTDKALLGDVVSTSTSSNYAKYGTSSEYKIDFKGTTYYVYKLSSGVILSKNHIGSSNCILLTDEIKKEWVKPADGIHASEKITVDSQEKYVYAVVSDSSQKITVYLADSAGLKDFSALTPYGTIQNPIYEFIPHELVYIKDGWKILCRSSFFKLSKEGAFADAKMTLEK